MLGKPVSVRRAGKSGVKQMSVSVLIRVSGGEHRLAMCATLAGPGLTPVKLNHWLGANPLPALSVGPCWCPGILQLTPLPRQYCTTPRHP